MKVTDITVHSATVTAKVELDAGEVSQLGLTIDEQSLAKLAQAQLSAPQLTPVSFIEHETQPSRYPALDDPNTLSDVVDERTAEIEAHKQRLDQRDSAKADEAHNNRKESL